MILQCCSSRELGHHRHHLLFTVQDAILFASPCTFSFPLASPCCTRSSASSRASLGFKPHCLPISSTISPSKPSNAAATTTTRKKNYGRSLPAILRALESEEEIDGTLDALVGRLSPKELTLLLKEQKDWRRALGIFRWMRSQKNYTPNPIHYNVMLRTLGRAREWDELRLRWIEMAKDGVFPTNNTYATLIDVYGKAGLVKEALLWLNHMRTRGVSPDEVTMNTVLRILKDSGQFDRAEKFFKGWCGGSVELDGVETDSDELDVDPLSPKHFLLTELFKSGGRAPFPKISSVPEEGSKRPRLAATYNTLIDLYGKAGRLKDASDAFADMLRSGVVPDTTTFNTMIHICGSHGHLSEVEALISKMEERRVIPDTKTFNILMSMHASVGSVEVVLKNYRKIRDSGLKPDAVTQRIILQVLCERKMVHDVEGVIEEMKKFNVHIDEQTLPVVMNMYIDEGLLDKAKMFFKKHCSGRGISSKNYAAIIDAYAEKGLWKEAEDVFSEKRGLEHKKDVTEYNVMVKAYGKAKLYDKALSLFQSMTSSGNWPDQCTYNSVIQMLCAGDFTDQARELLTKMVESGLRPRCETFSAVIASSTRAGLSSEAMDTYREMKRLGIKPNEVVYGSLIDALAESGKIQEALHYVHMMERSGFPVNQIVLTSLIKAYSKVGCWREAQELYAKIKDLKGGPDVITSNSMIGLYANLGMVSEAKLIFDDLRQNGRADGVSYAIMMYVYKSMGRLDEAIDVAQDMQQSGLLKDCSSFNNVMSSYAAKGQLRECGELLHQMLTRRILPDGVTFKVIFTVLKKGGISFEAMAQLESSYSDGKPYARQAIITSMFSVVGLHAFALESCKTFVMTEVALDSFAFNVAIYVYGVSGEIDRALNLFMRMQDEGLKPDLVTYINLAGCYGKAGLVEGVKRIYSKIKYGEIEPNESLFRAVIDAYKDAGKPDLAELVDQEMRFSLHVQEQNDSDSESDEEILV